MAGDEDVVAAGEAVAAMAAEPLPEQCGVWLGSPRAGLHGGE